MLTADITETHERIILGNFVGTTIRSFFIVRQSHAILGQSVFEFAQCLLLASHVEEQQRMGTSGSHGPCCIVWDALGAGKAEAALRVPYSKGCLKQSCRSGSEHAEFVHSD